jgi:hypothetical protein
MNNHGNSSERRIHIWIGGDIFIKFLVSLQDTICIKDNTNILFALSTDISIHSQIKYTTLVSALKHLFISG